MALVPSSKDKKEYGNYRGDKVGWIERSGQVAVGTKNSPAPAKSDSGKK